MGRVEESRRKVAERANGEIDGSERVNELGGQVAGWRKRQSGSKQLKGW